MTDIETRPTSRVLPPDVTAEQFEKALEAFRDAIGAQHVFDTDETVRPYYDAFPVTPNDADFAPSAVLVPGTTEEVQAIVRIANEYLIPVHAVSTGKNLGYGGSAPRTAGSVVLHLGARMNRILEVNDKYGYALVEPGVTYYDLYDYIQEHKLNLWIDAPDLAWGSIVGNTMDRGVGYTPYGNHSMWKCGLEVVLPDGDLLRTGLGGLPGSNAWQLFAPGFGPSPDNMFEQSNYGIVTKLGIQLMQPPPAAQTFQITFENADDIQAIIDTVLPLRINMAPLQNVPVLRNIFLDAAQVSTREEWYTGDGPIPDDVIKTMQKELNLGYWNFYGTVYGPPPIIDMYLSIIEGAFSQIPGAKFYTTDTRPHTADDRGAHTLHDRHKINTGVPTTEEANVFNWIPNAGHFFFSPISAPDGEDAARQFKAVKSLADEYVKDYAAQFIIGLREMHHISLLLYNTKDEASKAETLALTQQLIADGARDGYGEYRAHNALGDQVAETYSWNNHAQRRFNEKIKDALDPNGIINPGKSGIWPARLRGRGL
ncbi:FAD-binding protein [Subtercola boreus]|uniref:FAD-binding protein n=1 Tax=Subtercola boreus TaxID=120213 RepID=A0A3E0VHF5_9MICO|nr:FAD-binding oxidoreductase [Subtercola boreus]RFA09099.1 FAD-binding protein [Subtercola boreus]TQL53894.1 4-cresol dehydrogenase (hydroxylating) [Subtercola boreus]